MSTDEENELLDSWKHIAKYLRCNQRTARRWEKERRLPVHRVPGGSRGAVFSYRSEIDEWLRGAVPDSDLTHAKATDKPAAAKQPHFAIPSLAEPRTDGASVKRVLSSPMTDVARPVPVQVNPTDSLSSDQRDGFRWGRLRWGIAAFVVAVGTLVILGVAARWPSRDVSPRSSNEPSGMANAHHEKPGPWSPEVLSVQFTGKAADLGMYLNGLGFGHPPFRLPFTGDSIWLRVGDVSCFAIAPATCEAGYKGDDKHLTYISWTNSQILLSHFRGAAPGDAIEVAVWNPQAQSRQAAAVWGGNIPPVRQGTPKISSVIFTGGGRNLHITIIGKNFGKAPRGVPGVGDTAVLEFGDYAFHSPRVVLSTFFRAGYRSSAVLDCITVNYQSWANNRIEITGFGGAYGQNGMVVRRGDPVSIELWNTKTHLATAWGGRIP